MRNRLPLLSCLAVAGSLALSQAPASANDADELLQTFGDDLGRIGVNLPVWLSQHLPSVMSPVGVGAGSGISDDAGHIKFGLMSRIGLLNRLPDIAHGLQMVDIQSELPSLLPWPQFGAVFGMDLGEGFEIAADVQFIPAMDIAAENVNLRASLLAVSTAVRYRLNKADGLLPAVIFGVGGSYYSGDFGVGAGYESPYELELDDGTRVAGRARIDAAPGVRWSIFQIAPEVRFAWDIGGIIRPYIGFGAGFSFGDVSNSLSLRGTVTVDTVDGQPVNRDPETYETTAFSYGTNPARYTLRPHLGMDFILGVIALSVQLDLALSGSDRINTDFGDAANTWLSDDPNYLFNQNARSAQTHNAFVLTMAARVEF